MRLLTILAAMAVAAIAAPATESAIDHPNISEFTPNTFNGFLPINPDLTTDAANCEKPTRYGCGQYMLEDGTRQDFVSQVYKCLPRNQMICNHFQYAPYNPTHPGEQSKMIAAKVDPGCTCYFFT